MTDDKMYIASVVATYWFVSISMVYLNKVLMSNEALSIPAPIFITWYQCVCTVIICWVAGKIGERAQAMEAAQYQSVSQSEEVADGQQRSQPKALKPGFFAQFPKAEYSVGTGRKVLPLSLVFVGMITLNNVCLKLVEVSFYNVARSLTIVFNVLFSYVMLRIPSSTNTILCLLVVIVGFLIGGKGEINFSMVGTIAGVCSSLFVSLNSIFTKKMLPVVDDNHWRLTYYNNINACVLFVPLMLYFEMSIIKEHSAKLASGVFWSAMTVAGFFGFSIGIVTVLQIKATSPLSHNISGTAKAALQSLMAFGIWGNPATVMGVVGIFIVLGGSLSYTVVKMNENAAFRVPSRPQQSEEGT
eukprot:CAMPEP_0197720944 /NCGR_PEP_ID=MMETSP1434-20131217/4153_1 /TAXON_ID=265543 /ORGANISM="Minutocellus polymorphus, Strain CCMP3303" /LENGTH=356 /DNA_ID=CAMNT_0043305875 /DNA_START=195 /DNA_END=1265 /DNA_ORIENTATION=+